MNKEKIMSEYPSICYTCICARKPWSSKFRDEGWMGCTIMLRDEYGYAAVGEAKELATGWVDLRSKPFSKEGSGIVTNNMLLTLGVEHCRMYEQVEEEIDLLEHLF